MIEGLDTSSVTWKVLQEWAQKEIEQARDRLESKDDESERGRIKALRDFLELGVDRPRPIVPERAPRPDMM